MRKISKLKDLLIDYDHPNDWLYQLWKSKLPSNLKNTDTSIYDLYGAFKAGLQPELYKDGSYHLGSRDSNTGKILKKKNHPTYNKAIQSDIEAGYYPIEYNGDTYTRAPIPMGDFSGWQIDKYKDGGEYVIERTLPQITVTPNPYLRYYFNTMRPYLDKNVAVELAKELDDYRNFDNREDYFAILTDLHQTAGRPKVYSNGNPKYRFPNGGLRAYMQFSMNPFNGYRNAKLYNIVDDSENKISTLDNLLSELAHPILKRYGKNSITTNVIDDLLHGKIYSSDNKNSDDRSWYLRKDGGEFETHAVFEPMIKDAFTNENYSSENFRNLFTKDNIDFYRNAAEIYLDDAFNDYSEGGIHIKKKNRGKFTKSAKLHGMGVLEYARKVVNDPNATTLLKRRALFAINAKKFKH